LKRLICASIHQRIGGFPRPMWNASASPMPEPTYHLKAAPRAIYRPFQSGWMK